MYFTFLDKYICSFTQLLFRMRIFLPLLLLSVSSKSSRRKNRNRNHRRKIQKPRFHKLTPDESLAYSQKADLISDLISSDLQLANDDPFAASSFSECIQPIPKCTDDETCRRITNIHCSKGQCSQSPVQYCENVCTYQCNHDEPAITQPAPNTTMVPDLTSTPTAAANTTITPLTYFTTTTPPRVVIPEVTATYVNQTYSNTNTTLDLPESDWKPDLPQHNCEFLSNRGGYQCQNWQSPTLAKDIKTARYRKSNTLKRYLKTNQIMFDLPFDKDWAKIYQKHIPVMTREFLTQHLFSECMNYHFTLFNDKMPMPQRKLEAESIIMMVRIRDTCGMPHTYEEKPDAIGSMVLCKKLPKKPYNWPSTIFDTNV